LVDRRFVAQRPADLWVTDITYMSTWEGRLDVAFVLDVYSRAIVGWQIATHLRTEFVLDAIEMAIWRRDTTNGLTCHSDAGSQFTSYRYTDRLANAGITASIGSVGDSYDNAMAEALNGTYKAELIHRHRPWKTRQQPSSPSSNGSTGTTRPDFTARSATSHPSNVKPSGIKPTRRQSCSQHHKPDCIKPRGDSGFTHIDAAQWA
jgi:transposase InsO family protein